MTPAWHDVPPVPGVYTRQQSDGSYANVAVCVPKNWDRGRYYGPRDSELPDPPPLPEPPKPPRLFRCRVRASGLELWGLYWPGQSQRPYELRDMSGAAGSSWRNKYELEAGYEIIEWYDGAPPC